MGDFLKNIVNRPLSLIGYKISKIYSEGDAILDHEFKHIFLKYRNYTMTNLHRMYALYKSVKYIAKAGIPGDIVECGVWRGGSAMLVAHTLLEMGDTSRDLYLYDTYSGMSEPSLLDHLVSDKDNLALDEWKNNKGEDYNKWAYSSLDEVRSNMLSTGYPIEKIKFVEGKVEDTIPAVKPDQISLLRLDTDWYESTRHELNHLYPLLVKKGILILDDYGYWAGSKKAVDEYFANRPVLLSRIDSNGRIVVKVD